MFKIIIVFANNFLLCSGALKGIANRLGNVIKQSDQSSRTHDTEIGATGQNGMPVQGLAMLAFDSALANATIHREY